MFASLQRLLSQVPASTAFFSSATPSISMAVQQVVDSAISDHDITVFAKSWCPYCKRAKELFATNFPDNDTLVLDLDKRSDGQEIQEYLYRKTGQRTVPNVFVKGKHIGGSDDTAAAFKSGALQRLIEA